MDDRPTTHEQPDGLQQPDALQQPGGDGFASLGLDPELCAALEQLGYEEPTPIQRAAIPHVLSGRDVLGQAATGTGKTAAFALPLVSAADPQTRGSGPTALVLVPTRELAMQVSEAVHRYGRPRRVEVVPVYGGQPIGRQLGALARGVDVVVATPGRALDHLRRGSLRLAAVRTVVLDEADEMLDMGFADELDELLGAAPSERQTVLFSATMPTRIAALASSHLREPVRIQIEAAAADPSAGAQVRQVAYVVPRAHKTAALGRILDVEAPDAALVFCRTRVEVDELTETLTGRGYRAEALHGGMGQEQRDRVMARLRSGAAELLVATDVAARGLDVDSLTHVVNYDVPSASESYVHRIGRVGRAGRSGVALTLATPRERRLLRNIERATGRRIPIERVPSIEDLAEARVAATVAALRSRMELAGPPAGDQPGAEVVLERLLADHDVRDVAIAAIGLAHDHATGAVDDVDIPDAGPERSSGDAHGGGERGRSSRSKAPGRGREGGPRARLFVSAGRAAGVRPKDLVGAITGETSLSGQQVGPLQIAERHSLVEVPEEAVDEVLAAMSSTTIKGRKVRVRRDRNRT